MSNVVRFAAYGTLRKGNYNYDRFKGAYTDEFEYIQTLTSDEKFVMLDNGMYPLLMHKKKNCEPTKIVFDIIECSEECYKDIQAMEFGAGYEEDTVTLQGQQYNIFIFNHETNYEQIKTGDWNNKEGHSTFSKELIEKIRRANSAQRNEVPKAKRAYYDKPVTSAESYPVPDPKD